MDSKQALLKARTRALAVESCRLCRRLRRTYETHILVSQLIRSATSAAANYRAACRARSRREFAARLAVVIEETDETLFWLELLEELGHLAGDQLAGLKREANELTAIFVVARATTIKNGRRPAR